MAVGFLGCSVLGRLWSRQNIYEHFLRLHPFLEGETSYFPTASQLAAIARAECPPATNKTLVILGGNSVFNGSGQTSYELWSRVLQNDLGDGYHVVNFSAPGAGVVDNGGVVFEMLSREYPRMLFVTNTEPGYYPPAEDSAYSYLFWDAYYKGTLMDDPVRTARLARIPNRDGNEFNLGRRLNSVFYFNDLWTGIAYRHISTVWTSWLKERSLHARRRLPDWYDERLARKGEVQKSEDLSLAPLAGLRRRKSLAPERFRREPDGAWVQTGESLRQDAEAIAELLPAPLQRRSLVVLTPFNPWVVERLTDDERQWVALTFQNGSALLKGAGFHVLSGADSRFEPADFGDIVHMTPAGGRRLAHLVADALRDMVGEQATPAAK